MIKLEANEELNDLLGFDDMKIIQRTDMLNFSLDSVLLAHFVTLPAKAKQIVEIGTGHAPIPLFLSTRTKANITAFDIQPEAVELAQKNISLNELEKQVSVELQDINTVRESYPNQFADVVVSNPPFFKVNEKRQQNENEYLTIARHEVALDLEGLVNNASYLLNNNGYFAMVHRPDRLIEIINMLQKYKLEPKRMQFVYPKVGKESNILLIEARKNGQPGLKILEPFIVHEDDGSYKPAVLEMFQRNKN